jgi:hypothetical protein
LLDLHHRVRQNCTHGSQCQCQAIQNEIHMVNKKTINLRIFPTREAQTKDDCWTKEL